MPIYLHIANLILDKTAIEKRYAGGIKKFRKDYSIGGDNYNQEDEELFAIARMNIDEFDIEKLVKEGLHFDENLPFSADFTIRPRYGTYLWNTEWITDNDVFAWHVNTNIDSIAKATMIGNLTMDKIAAMFDNGANPFATII